jgi:transcriptional regulator of acetoin/glycerol metabolism
MQHSSALTDTHPRTARLLRERLGSEPVSEHVITSWQRCLTEYGTEPDSRRDTPVLDAVALRERQQRFGNLLQVAKAEMENLYQQIAGSGYAVILSDADATILGAITDTSLQREFRESGLRVGAIWNERYEGTNGLGTCLAAGSPVTIHKGEHFRRFNTGLTCSGAPVLGIQGEMLGVLDASTIHSADTRLIQRHTMALVSMSSNLISRCHFLQQLTHSWVMRFHSRPEFVGLLHEALLAVDENGRVQAVNESALAQLGMPREQLIGNTLSSVFPFDLDELQKRAAGDPTTLWPIRDVAYGRRFFAMARAPSGFIRATASTSQRRVADPCMAIVPPRRHVGSDPRMQHNISCGRQLFGRRVPILLQGATGTGKEAFAKALHQASGWAERAFVAVNCAAIPENLIESELFGYNRGAFTDAAREGHQGKIRLASGGTLFLDEIGDMPLHMQTRLLRVLEEHEVVPLGGEKAIPVDLHVISATHQNLLDMVQQGRFREDLYYRLNGITLQLPALRERADRRELISALLAEESPDGRADTISEAAMQLLLQHPWPGNIRQLRNALRTASALCGGRTIEPRHLPQEIAGYAAAATIGHGDLPGAAEPAATEAAPLQAAERGTLLRELERMHWNISRTATELGLSRNTLYRKMRKHAIPLPD